MLASVSASVDMRMLHPLIAVQWASGLLQHILSRRRGTRRVPFVTEFAGSATLPAAALKRPVGPDFPPTPCMLLGLLQPLLGIGSWPGTQVVIRLRISGRIDQTCDVPSVAEHKGAWAAQQLRRAIAGF